MIITKRHLPRRTFLRGLSLALPLLDAMVPAQAAAASAIGARPKYCFKTGACCPTKLPTIESRRAEIVMNNHPIVKLFFAPLFGAAAGAGNSPPERRTRSTKQPPKGEEREPDNINTSYQAELRSSDSRLPGIGLHLEEIGRFCDARLAAMVEAVQKIGFWPVFAIALLLLTFAGFAMWESQSLLRDIFREFLNYVATLEVATILTILSLSSTRWLGGGQPDHRIFVLLMVRL
ncbi:MAG TPA: hypothetical protein VMH80_08000 [Bryobacteraceae bacterium]|nr:hypothetical protein [Bryobacteraceae bacterium]